MAISETRRFTIERKIFRLKDVYRIGQLVWDEYQQVADGKKATDLAKKGIFVEFVAQCDDNTTFKSRELDLLAPESQMEYKIVKTLEITFKDSIEKEFKLVLQQTKDYESSNSYFEVSGIDSMWVNAMSAKTLEVLKGVQDQFPFLVKNEKIVRRIAIPVGFIFTGLVYDVLKGTQDISQSVWVRFFYTDWANRILFVVLGLFVGGTAGMKIVDWAYEKWVISLWPALELDIGPEWKSLPRKRRTATWLVFTLLILPLVLSAIFHVVISI